MASPADTHRSLVGSRGLVTLLALAIAILLAGRLLASSGGDPTIFTAFGEEATRTTEYAEAKLGREVLTRPEQGHDGKFFFVQANDPLVLDPDRNAEIIDRPAYRSQRMLYPLIAGGIGLFPPGVIVWALPVVNVLALALGSWAVASIAHRHGLPAWLGLAFALNIGLLSELVIDGAGILAFALACLGALALEDDRPIGAAAAFTGAVLAREVMAIFVGFVALFWLIRRKRVPWLVAIPPAVAMLGWAAYIRLRIDVGPTPGAWRELEMMPFAGVVESLTSGRGRYIDYLVMTVFLALVVLVPYRAWKSDVYLTWGAVGFAAISPFLSGFVWQKYFDISRALAPLATVFLFEFLLARRRGRLGQPPLQSAGPGIGANATRP